MLQNLTIENIAVIKKATLEFPSGFVVLTGETGAGKSILIDAINAVLGERTSRELIRTGADSARVTAVFSDAGAAAAQLLEELDVAAEEDGSLLLHRSITAAGKNQCRVNGAPVTVSALRRLGQALINIHGQHDTQALLAPEQHIRFIDAMAENDALRGEYRASYTRLRQIQREQDALRLNETEKALRLDMLRHQIAELEEAGVQPGERQALLAKQSLCRHAEKILQALYEATTALAGEGEAPSAAELAHRGAAALEQAGAFYPAAQALGERVRSAAYELEEGALELRGLLEGVEFDPAEAEETERRLDVYFRLSRKYGETEEEMLAFLGRAQAEENSVTQSGERIAALEEEITVQRSATIALAKQLTRSRRTAAEQFSQRVCEELAALDMPNVKFAATHEKIPLTAEGGDSMAFLLSANAGEELRPLARIASGGELSRVMLAIKNVLAEKDAIPTLIFDEVDAGVSGRAAQKIARKLRQVSRGRQVICVTHLAQIAALADCHLCISKSTSGDETFTEVTPLDHEGRKRELARIMGGEEITKTQLQAAEEMLRLAASQAAVPQSP
ncbi:MAG: DNA repair protein RecN [Oscillospiraceae bacterium]|jgi:DNA repair protein RecN (Recombination protein N)|nr:DNA repair protein RecN [Oscillospiraceae bacterium]